MEHFYNIKGARTYTSGRCKLNRWYWHWGHHEDRIHVFISTISSLYVIFLCVLTLPPIADDWINVENHCLVQTLHICGLGSTMYACVCVVSYVFIPISLCKVAKCSTWWEWVGQKCISSNLDGGGEQRNDYLLLCFLSHYMLSLHLLYKYKHNKKSIRKRKKNMQICNTKKTNYIHLWKRIGREKQFWSFTRKMESICSPV